MKTLKKKQLIKLLERVIKLVCADIVKKGSAGSEKLKHLSALVNSYNRLTAGTPDRDEMQWGALGSYEKMLAEEDRNR